ncbi:hypothetical protein BDW66DRAFT_156747 [Aspergillus desertorum]
MDEDELWLSEEIEDDEDEDFTDPSSFTMALTYQGPPGECTFEAFRTRNKPGERQRPLVSAFRAGPRKKPAFTVSCNSKAIIHGKMGGNSAKMATLLIYEFTFRSYRGARLKEADILFEFKPRPGTTGRISVAKVRPDGVHKMRRTEQIEGHSVWAGVNGAAMQAVGAEVGAERSVEKTANYHTIITGDRPQDWGDYYEARFTLSENKSQRDGIPSALTVCILLERGDNQDFVCVPTISVRPNFKTVVATLFSTRDPDDPIYFSVEEPPINLLESRIKIDSANLAGTNLDEAWDCTITTMVVDLADDFADLNLGPGYPGALGLNFIGPLPDQELELHGRHWTKVVHVLETGREEWDSLDEADKLALAYHDDKNKGRPTFLHKMAENWASGEFRELSMEIRQQIVLFLLDQRIEHTDGQDDPVLTVAIRYHTTDFIQFIIDHRPDMLRNLLMATNVDKMNCLHCAFKETLLAVMPWTNKKTDKFISTMSIITRLLEYADTGIVTAPDALGNTPIHYAMDYRLCHIAGEYRFDGQDHKYEDTIRTLLSKAQSVMKKPGVLFNRRDYSPYRYYFLVEAKIEQLKKNVQPPLEKEAKSRTKEIVKEDRRDPKKSTLKPTVRDHLSRATVSLKEEPSQSATFTKTPTLPRVVQKAARDPQHLPAPSVFVEKENSLAEPKNGLLSRKPTANFDTTENEHQQNPGTDTAKPARPANPEGSIAGSAAETPSWPGKEEKKAAAEILAFVKCFLIRSSSDRDAKDLLYGKVASDKNLFFDASHFRGKNVDDVVRLIEKVSKAGGFEDTLSYVRIPKLASEAENGPKGLRQIVANEKRQLNRGHVDRQPKGRETLIKVFDKLVEVNVRKILRLEVEDNADEWAHTDAAIERAIRGYTQYSSGERKESLEVAEWDWRKPDLNLDVINHAVPLVEHIHLHWSGNQAVLYGWASSENGIPLLCRNPRSVLSKITLHAYQADGDQDPLLAEQSEKPRSDAWLEAMKKFRDALKGLHDTGLLGQPKRVRVALIDDGIDIDDFNTYNNTTQYTGVSYCDEDAWWKSTEGHGTVMANMISRVNPWVRLDVIKIQSSPSFIHGEGARSISAKSAADAINAAVKHGADIISMSWTITDLEYRLSLISENMSDAAGDRKHAERNDLHLLRTAIAEAVKDDKRLLICSAADDIRLIGDSTLPYSEASGQILCIGSTGPLANRDPGSGSQNSITYYLPGNQVAEEQRSHSAKPVVYHNGSSVSTALAAGLASLIMYCCQCLHTSGAGDEYKVWAQALREHTNMRKAFSSINRWLDWKEDKKIVPVWGIFRNKGSELDKASSGQDKIKVLKELVTYLCQDVVLKKKLLPQAAARD